MRWPRPRRSATASGRAASRPSSWRATHLGQVGALTAGRDLTGTRGGPGGGRTGRLGGGTDRQQGVAGLQRLARRAGHGHHDARHRGSHGVLHLHGLEHGHGLADAHVLPHRHLDRHHGPREGRADGDRLLRRIHPGHVDVGLEVGAGTVVRQVGAATGAGATGTRGELVAHLVELLAGGHLLGEEGGLDAVEEPLEPAHELGLGDAQLGVGGVLVVAEGQRQAPELVAQVGRQRRAELAAPTCRR